MASVWSVTVAEVGRLARMSFDASTEPSESDITAMIGESGLYLDGLLGSLGVDDVTQSTYPEAYAIGRRWIMHDVAAQSLRARARGGSGTLAKDLQDRADRLEERIESRVSRLGDGHPRGDDAANMTRTPLQGSSSANRANVDADFFDPRANQTGRL